MFKRFALILIVLCTVVLNGCVSPSSGLVLYRDVKDGYRFLYPNGWQEAKINKENGLDILFHDIIEPSENVSVVIGKLQSVKDLHELGSASDVGLRVLRRIIAPNFSEQAELLSANERDVDGRAYYTFEYLIPLRGGEVRHTLVTVTSNKDNLYTLSASARASRWARVKQLFQQVADSFVVE
ncbi:MAG: photosystem II reaction center PsbP [Pseudanabaenaceae cyanobacterium]